MSVSEAIRAPVSIAEYGEHEVVAAHPGQSIVLLAWVLQGPAGSYWQPGADLIPATQTGAFHPSGWLRTGVGEALVLSTEDAAGGAVVYALVGDAGGGSPSESPTFDSDMVTFDSDLYTMDGA